MWSGADKYSLLLLKWDENKAVIFRNGTERIDTAIVDALSYHAWHYHVKFGCKGASGQGFTQKPNRWTEVISMCPLPLLKFITGGIMIKSYIHFHTWSHDLIYQNKKPSLKHMTTLIHHTIPLGVGETTDHKSSMAPLKACCLFCYRLQ